MILDGAAILQLGGGFHLFDCFIFLRRSFGGVVPLRNVRLQSLVSARFSQVLGVLVEFEGLFHLGAFRGLLDGQELRDVDLGRGQHCVVLLPLGLDLFAFACGDRSVVGVRDQLGLGFC